MLLVPDMLHWDELAHWSNRARAWDENSGAWILPLHTLRESDKNKVCPRAGYFSIRYHYTSNMAPHPVTRCVHGIWYPIYGASRSSGKIAISFREVLAYPILPGKEWAIIVRGGKTSSSMADVRNDLPQQGGSVIDMTETILSAPALFAVRNYARGWIAFFAMNAEHHFVAGIHHNKGGNMEELRGGYPLQKGFDNRRSDLLKLLVNTLRRLVEPGMAGRNPGAYRQDPSRLEEPAAPRSPVVNWDRGLQTDQMHGLKLAKAAGFRDWPVFKGIIGAQTNYSGGKGTVADYKAAAKPVGLDFAVFLEEFANQAESDFEKLKKDCAAQSDESTLLLPCSLVVIQIVCGPLPAPGQSFNS